MRIVEVSTGRTYPVEITPVESSDYKQLTKRRYFFDWKEEKKHEVYKLTIKDAENILGLISVERIIDEWRIHIRLLTVSKENKGNKKIYDKIAGNLLAHAAKIAVMEFGELACISLRPKSLIAAHYMNNYKMKLTGMTLSLEFPEILNLINQFENG